MELAVALPVMLSVEKFGNEADDAIEMDAPSLAALIWLAPSCDEEEEGAGQRTTGALPSGRFGV